MVENEKLDPEIADLLGIQSGTADPEIGTAGQTAPSTDKIQKTEMRSLNLHGFLTDKNHYSKIIDMTGEYGTRLNEILSKFLKATDKDEKSMYRERLTPAYWNMLTHLINNFFSSLTDEKQALYRYGLLNNTFIDASQRNILMSINTSTTQDDFSFVDEWLLKVGNGIISPSSIDETVKAKKKSPSAVKAKLDRKRGSKDAEHVNFKQKSEQHRMIEKSLKSCITIILNHDLISEYENVLAPYNSEQKKALLQVQNITKSLIKSNKDIEASYRTLVGLDGDIKSLQNSGIDLSVEVDTKTVTEEFLSIRQMIKLTVGRQGNHFPFLIKYYMPNSDIEVCTKNNLEKTLKEIEAIDPGVFIRKYKQEEHRIVPRFIIVPAYGNYGICWEPFERMNKATSKGRIAVPMFPRDLKIAVLNALGDLRWQIAKEKALHYWMEEGLTGHYYEYSQKNKLKGDLKQAFIQDYILWIKFESQGMQKLNREVRTIFWRYIPFTQELKETLKNRGFYYSELYKKDQTRAMSRGY